MLKIRLRRVGKRNQPVYRVVVTEHTAPVKGSFLESLGAYNPRASQFTVNQDRILYWLDHGAQPSERMAKLLTNAGVKHTLISLPDYDRKPKRASKKAVVATETPATPTPEATDESTPEQESAPVEDGSTPPETPDLEEQPIE